MPLLVQKPAATHREHFVDRVGELQPAVLDVHRGARMREIAPIDIGDPPAGIFPPRGHGVSSPAPLCVIPRESGGPSARASARAKNLFAARTRRGWVARSSR